jgi:hypothetical protein
MQVLVILLVAFVVLVLIGFLISALKWLLILAAVVVAICLLAGWRPGRDRSRTR